MTLLCATDRPRSNTRKVVDKYSEILSSSGVEHRVCLLEEMPAKELLASSYGSPTEALADWAEVYFGSAKKMVVVAPEYNGSYPGIFKLLLDVLPQSTLQGMRVALVGVASGKAGNLRGLDQLTGVLHYLKAEVYSQKVYVPGLHQYLDAEQGFVSRELEQRLQVQLNGFLTY